MKYPIPRFLFLLTILINMLPALASGSDCCPRQYECSLNPLYCDAWSAQIYTGVAPITWTKRDPVLFVSCDQINPLVTVSEHFPRFSQLFKTPWIIGGILGYALHENTEIFLEANYLQAKAKHRDTGFVFTFPNTTDTIAFTFERYRLVDAYVGVRYYSDRCWCNTAWFLGAKVGFTHHNNTNGALVVNCSFLCDGFDTACDASSSAFLKSNNVLSGGLITGLDYCWCNNWSIILNFEIIASCAASTIAFSSFEQALPITLLPTNLVLGSLGTELRFPITLGLKYSF